MIGLIGDALHARRAAIREADKLVGAFGRRGSEMAEGFAMDPNVSAERRVHFRLIARHARRRNDFLSHLDTATRYYELGRISRKA